VNRADARAGEHGDGGLGHHAHVQDHALALLNAELPQRRRRLTKRLVRLAVGEAPHIARLVARDQPALAPSGEVPQSTWMLQPYQWIL